MKNKTIWLENIDFDKPKKLEKNDNVDVLIIGGGITGLTTAYHLIDSNLKVSLVEKNLIAHAVSSRTTGKLTYLQENIYTKLKSNAKLYYESQKEAINIVENIIKKNNIDCNFEKVNSYIYATNKNEIEKIKQEEEMLKNLNIEYKVHTRLPIKLKCTYALSVDNTAVFHPIKYLKSSKEIIKAKKVVVASHYPFFISPLFVPIKTYLERSYISASIIDKTACFSAITVSNNTKSIRYHKDNKNYFIYLNGSHNLCSKYNYKNNFNNLIKELKKKNITPNYLWSNHDIMTEDNLPYIGYIDDNLLIGTGYNTWGMTNGTLAGKIISDLILNRNNKYIELFNPKRDKAIINILKYPLYISYSAKSFIENKLIKNKTWYNKNIKFTKIDNKNVAIYKDHLNKEHIVYNKCPHLKCSLIFNEQELTWDCPCHGSRFDIDGNCIFGPSNKNIGFKKNNKQ